MSNYFERRSDSLPVRFAIRSVCIRDGGAPPRVSTCISDSQVYFGYTTVAAEQGLKRQIIRAFSVFWDDSEVLAVDWAVLWDAKHAICNPRCISDSQSSPQRYAHTHGANTVTNITNLHGIVITCNDCNYNLRLWDTYLRVWDTYLSIGDVISEFEIYISDISPRRR